jgi:hypothetical protein
MTALHPCTCGPNGNCALSCPNRREPKRRAALRSVTPGGFARAFFEANP